ASAQQRQQRLVNQLYLPADDFPQLRAPAREKLLRCATLRHHFRFFIHALSPSLISFRSFVICRSSRRTISSAPFALSREYSASRAAFKSSANSGPAYPNRAATAAAI